VLHVDMNSLMNTVILQCADHLQPRSIADVSEPRITMSTEISLENASVFCAIEHCAPRFELAHTIRGFLRVYFSHAPLIDVLTAAHGMREMQLPIVAFIDMGQGRCNSALRHYRVRFAQKRFADQSNPNACSRSFNRSPQSCAAGADHENVIFKSFVLRHGDR